MSEIKLTDNMIALLEYAERMGPYGAEIGGRAWARPAGELARRGLIVIKQAKRRCDWNRIFLTAAGRKALQAK
jgi:hypothetical protein